MKNLTIGKAAGKAGVGVETIRFYERKGLITRPPKPASGGYRSYPEDVVRRIRFIRQGQDLGFSLRQIGELLALQADPGSDCSEVRDRARAKLDEVEAKIARLTDMRGALEALIAACPGTGALRACCILDALDGAGAAPPRDHQQKERSR